MSFTPCPFLAWGLRNKLRGRTHRLPAHGQKLLRKSNKPTPAEVARAMEFFAQPIEEPKR